VRVRGGETVLGGFGDSSSDGRESEAHFFPTSFYMVCAVVFYPILHTGRLLCVPASFL
jgi:hypothetical protein